MEDKNLSEAGKDLATQTAECPSPAPEQGLDVQAMRLAAEIAQLEGRYYVSVPIEQQLLLINEAVAGRNPAKGEKA